MTLYDIFARLSDPLPCDILLRSVTLARLVQIRRRIHRILILVAMAKISDLNGFADEAVLPQSDLSIAYLPQPDQSFIMALDTEDAPIMREEYMGPMYRATADRQLQNGGTITPLDVGLPNAQHHFFPHLEEQTPAYEAQDQHMGANNLYQSPFTSDMIGIGAITGNGNPTYSVDQNSASFPMPNNYLHNQGLTVPNSPTPLNCSGSDMPFGLAQHPFNQAPNHQTSFSEMLMLQHAEPTAHSAQRMIYAEPNPPPVYADENPTEIMGQLHDPSRVEYRSKEDLEGMQDGFGVPTVPEEELFPRIPYIDHKFRQARQKMLFQNQPMIPPPIVTDTAIPNHPHIVDSSLPNSLAALNEEALQNATFDAFGLYEHGQSSVPEFAMRGTTPIEMANVWVDHGFIAPDITTKSIFLQQGQSNTLSRVADIPGFDSLYDPRYEQMGLPCDPHIRLLLAIHHGNAAQGQDENSPIYIP
ncbi:hypothetical protein MLD38_034777 [Melastoma candidum]|uniref:Uncharacterized protein n=1 Tax=Melastoma candidum TaxID=119954 RepID=A0ACB9MBN1_9MYRT|nr:hypothetical protein MLD38_034777 [Melastoma candidum]